MELPSAARTRNSLHFTHSKVCFILRQDEVNQAMKRSLANLYLVHVI